MTTSNRTASAAEFPAIARCLARAFDDDPVSGFLFPDPRARRARLESFYRIVLGMMESHGAIQVDAEMRGAAVWQAPSPPKPSLLDGIVGALVMMSVLRTASLRALALGRAVNAVHIAEPHWYLSLLGTDPAHQGQGVGSALVAPILERCDREGVPAYLESSREENVPFYERLGFRVTQVLSVPSGPTLWAMLRAPAQ